VECFYCFSGVDTPRLIGCYGAAIGGTSGNSRHLCASAAHHYCLPERLLCDPLLTNKAWICPLCAPSSSASLLSMTRAEGGSTPTTTLTPLQGNASSSLCDIWPTLPTETLRMEPMTLGHVSFTSPFRYFQSIIAQQPHYYQHYLPSYMSGVMDASQQSHQQHQQHRSSHSKSRRVSSGSSPIFDRWGHRKRDDATSAAEALVNQLLQPLPGSSTSSSASSSSSRHGHGHSGGGRHNNNKRRRGSGGDAADGVGGSDDEGDRASSQSRSRHNKRDFTAAPIALAQQRSSAITTTSDQQTDDMKISMKEVTINNTNNNGNSNNNQTDDDDDGPPPLLAPPTGSSHSSSKLSTTPTTSSTSTSTTRVGGAPVAVGGVQPSLSSIGSGSFGSQSRRDADAIGPACSNCRARKARCDRLRPCGRCHQRHLPCS
jgi:hypothetical protein